MYLQEGSRLPLGCLESPTMAHVFWAFLLYTLGIKVSDAEEFPRRRSQKKRGIVGMIQPLLRKRRPREISLIAESSPFLPPHGTCV